MFQRKGFTLIEILIVIAIIGVLSSILFVSLTNSKQKANVAAFKKTLSSLKAGVALCCSNPDNSFSMAGPLRTNKVPGGGPVCNPANGSLLPNATELNLGLNGSSYYFYWGTNASDTTTYNCKGSAELRIDIINNSNSNCSGLYSVKVDAVRYFNGATFVVGFPSGC